MHSDPTRGNYDDYFLEENFRENERVVSPCYVSHSPRRSFDFIPASGRSLVFVLGFACLDFCLCWLGWIRSVDCTSNNEDAQFDRQCFIARSATAQKKALCCRLLPSSLLDPPVYTTICCRKLAIDQKMPLRAEVHCRRILINGLPCMVCPPSDSCCLRNPQVTGEFKVTFIYRKFINLYTDKFII